MKDVSKKLLFERILLLLLLLKVVSEEKHATASHTTTTQTSKSQNTTRLPVDKTLLRSSVSIYDEDPISSRVRICRIV